MAQSNKQRHKAIAWDDKGIPLAIFEANIPKRLIKAWIKLDQPHAHKITIERI